MALVWAAMPKDFLTVNPIPEFARRWDGTCTGWTKDLATFHIAGDLILWHAYCWIPLSLLRLHPMPKSMLWGWVTLWLMALFIVGCGSVHLFDAYTVFVPVYWWSGAWKMYVGLFSELAAVFVSYSLVMATKLMAEREKAMGRQEQANRG